MKRLSIGLIATCLVAGTLSTLSFAQEGKTPTPAKSDTAKASSAALKCPSCGMPMPTKKTAKLPQPIKIDGQTYYCCTGCPSGKQAAAYSKAHKGEVLSIDTKKPATTGSK